MVYKKTLCGILLAGTLVLGGCDNYHTKKLDDNYHTKKLEQPEESQSR